MADFSGAESIGFLLGGGAKHLRESAFEEGRLRTARTEDALANARKKQLEATALAAQEKEFESIGDAIAATGDPNAALITAMMRAGRGNAQQLAGGLLGGQEFGQRQTLADPATPIGEQFAAGQGVQGKVLPQLEAVGAGDAVNLLDEEQALAPTPLGLTMQRENLASAALSDERRINPQRFLQGGGEGGDKAPSGFKLNPNFDPSLPEEGANTELLARTGGPQDPNTKGRLGTRERQVVGRVLTAGANTASDLANIVSLPSGASTGFLGSGIAALPAVGILDATAGHLKQKVSSTEQRRYQALLGGLTTQLSTLEKQGMQGSQALAEQYETLVLRPSDTIADKMWKLALIKQTTVNGLESLLAINPLSKDSQAHVRAIIQRVGKAVPYDPDDVIALETAQNANPQATMKEIIAQKIAQTPEAVTLDVDLEPEVESEQALEELLITQGLGQHDEQGQIVDERGWIFMRSADGSPAWVSPDGAEFEPIAE